jgi:GTP-binding protein LepA
VDNILEAIVHSLPPPLNANSSAPLRALIFDSYYDAFRGVIVFFRVVDGTVCKGDRIRFLNSKTEYDVLEVGVVTPEQRKTDVLRAGEVGFLSANIKAIDHARVGDTFTLAKHGDTIAPLPGYEPAKQMVFAGLYPTESDDYEAMREALGKLKLNDASFTFTPETSTAMGFGFRCGFLGLLHMEIVQERLEREYDMDLIITAPSVVYKVILNNPDRDEVLIDTPARLPDQSTIQDILEPFVRLEMISPSEYTGALMELAKTRRGVFVEMKYLTPTRTTLVYEVKSS